MTRNCYGVLRHLPVIMHELSLAKNIVDVALHAEGVTKENLRALNISCGALSGANAESLRFCLRLVLEEQGLEDVTADITEIPAELQCGCGYRYNAESLFCKCPDCGDAEHSVTAGKDVFLESVEVDDG